MSQTVPLSDRVVLTKLARIRTVDRSSNVDRLMEAASPWRGSVEQVMGQVLLSFIVTMLLGSCAAFVFGGAAWLAFAITVLVSGVVMSVAATILVNRVKDDWRTATARTVVTLANQYNKELPTWKEIIKDLRTRGEFVVSDAAERELHEIECLLKEEMRHLDRLYEADPHYTKSAPTLLQVDGMTITDGIRDARLQRVEELHESLERRRIMRTELAGI